MKILVFILTQDIGCEYQCEEYYGCFLSLYKAMELAVKNQLDLSLAKTASLNDEWNIYNDENGITYFKSPDSWSYLCTIIIEVIEAKQDRKNG